jgi:hypothetical protein
MEAFPEMHLRKIKPNESETYGIRNRRNLQRAGKSA